MLKRAATVSPPVSVRRVGGTSATASTIKGEDVLTIHVLKYDFSRVLKHGELDKNFIEEVKSILNHRGSKHPTK
ncbi:MAG: hypothetical protein QXU35_01750 [Zestosphaera sp.]